MSDPPQARFNSTDHHRNALLYLAAAGGVDDHRAIGPSPGLAARRVGVVRARLAIGGVVVDQRVHVAAGHPPKQVGRAELGERFWILPVGLGEDPDAKALVLEGPADDRCTEADVIDVGVAGHQDHVAAVPAERVHLGARGRQERRDAEAMRPVLAPSEQRRRARSGHSHGRQGSPVSDALKIPAGARARRPARARAPGPRGSAWPRRTACPTA
jgi:hypothetical protein